MFEFMWPALAFIGCVLGIWNTIILLRRALIHKEDLVLLLDVLERVARLTPGSADEEMIRKIRRIIEEHG